MADGLPTHTITRQHGETTVAITGDIDLTTSAHLLDELRDLISETPTHLVIDIAAVEFCDSSGIRTLLTAKRDADAANVAVSIIHTHPHVYRVFTITGVAKILNATPNPT